MAKQPNIVQAEFFHTAGAESLNELCLTIIGGLADGAPIKTVVRYYDDTGFITRCALEVDRLRIKALYEKKNLPVRRGILALLVRFLVWRAKVHQDRAEQILQRILGSALQNAIRNASPMAVETADHRFRMAEPDELHELQEAARRSGKAWLFIFKNNDLLSDVNKGVVSVF
ncbi:MAG: hypothetical protein KGH79_04750 [Patescibacteria group bacterium]|nr:hypothetical protein [Patescibacteria group bacterium]